MAKNKKNDWLYGFGEMNRNLSYDIIKLISKISNRKTINAHQYDDVIEAAEILIKLEGIEYYCGFGDSIEEFYSKIITKLEFIYMNDDWIESWKDPKILKKCITKQIKELNRIKNKYKD